MKESMTITEALFYVIQTLSHIKIPVSEVNDMGIPISESIEIINKCIDSIKEQGHKAESGPDSAEDSGNA